MLPRSSLFRSLLLSLAVTFGLLSAALAGPVRDGNYAGQLQCSAVIGNPSNAGWSSPVELQVVGDTVLWQRGNGQFSESAQVRWSRGGFEIDALGALPVTILYDASGREVWRYLGDRDWTSEESLKLISEAPLVPQS